MKYKHFIFDMDCTLTESRAQIKKQMAEGLQKILDKGGDIVVITGADNPRIKKQMKGAPKGITYLSQNGNCCKYWEHKLNQEQKNVILEHIHLIKEIYSDLFVDVDHNDLIQDRGCQITFSLVGHHADPKRKKVFDPDGERRSKIITEHAFVHPELMARLGGTTSIDYTLENGSKGENIRALLKVKDWQAEDCLYMGDAIYPNGNDGTLVGIVPNLINVDGPGETLKIVNKLCK